MHVNLLSNNINDQYMPRSLKRTHPADLIIKVNICEQPRSTDLNDNDVVSMQTTFSHYFGTFKTICLMSTDKLQSI